MSLYGDVDLESRTRDFLNLESKKGYVVKIVNNVKNKYDKTVSIIIQKNEIIPHYGVMEHYYFIVYNNKFDNKYWWTSNYTDLDKRKGEYAAFIPFDVVQTMRQKDHAIFPKDRSFYIIALPDQFYIFSAKDSDKYNCKFPIKHAMIVKNKMIFVTRDLLKEYA